MRGARHGVALLLALASWACGGTPGAVLVTPSATARGNPAATASPAGPAAQPQVSITQPADGSSVPAGDVAITANVSGIRLVDKVGQPPSAGEGHLIYYVGVDYVPTEPGRPARTAEGTYAVAAASSYTWPGLGAGTYGVAVQVVNNDDTPLQPPAVARVTITVT